MNRGSPRGGEFLSFTMLGAVAVAMVACGVGSQAGPGSETGGLAVACEPDGGRCDGGVALDGGPRDGGPDGGRDGGPDGGPRDGGPDGGPRDGGPDGGPRDGGPDGGPDGGHDGGICDGAPAGFFLDGAAPADCKWNIPPDTREVYPANFILDFKVVNVVGKFQTTETHTYGMCSQDEKDTANGSVQICIRPAANPIGWCVAGSGGFTHENGSCNTPFCECEGANGQCRDPGCSLGIDNKQGGGGGGINIKGPAGDGSAIPFVGKYLPQNSKWNFNANLIAQVGGGVATDTRFGSSPCFNCCPNGNPKRDNNTHVNFEIKGTIFATLRLWNVCATATVNAGYCYQLDMIDRLQCDGTKTSLNRNLNYLFGSFGNIYVGLCTGDKDEKKNARGGICAYDTTSHTLKCGIGWFNYSIPIPADISTDFGSGATSDICLF